MADVINLNKARKQRERAEREREAAANRVKFGRTRAEKQRDEAAIEEARRKLEQLKLETPADDDSN